MIPHGSCPVCKNDALVADLPKIFKLRFVARSQQQRRAGFGHFSIDPTIFAWFCGKTISWNIA